jgi:hypothetical protein
MGGRVFSQSGSGRLAEEITFVAADAILVIHSTHTFIPSQPKLLHFLKVYLYIKYLAIRSAW